MSMINADPNKMRAFAGYVSEFSKNILNDCAALESATQKLASSTSSEEMRTIENMVETIESIIHDSAPVFQKLDGALNIYADYIDRAKKAIKGG